MLCEGLEADLLSISPKLTHSTPWSRAPSLADRHERARLNPAVLRRLVDNFTWQLKFVVRTQTTETLAVDLIEIEQMLDVLQIPYRQRTSVLLMPKAVDAETLRAGYTALVAICKTTGMRIGQRFHIELKIS